MKEHIELLAPASSYESVTAAINNGCDAVYIGGRLFNARAYADSPDNEKLIEIIDLCHIHGVKIFITLNTLYKNSELKDVMAFAHLMYEAGADAFIIQDIGFLMLAKKYFPDIELHCSTQMTIHNKDAASWFDRQGFERIVPSRELSLEEINEIRSNVNCDIECFVHGALCVCYSGRCLMSSILGGRSGNRGRCAQPCRLEYTLYKNNKKLQSGHLLSPKDICTVDMTDPLAAAGITSFKIEGRMKSPEYVAQVVSSYRHAIDGNKITKAEICDLKQIFNRGGSFSNGYYNCFSGNDMMSGSPKSSGIMVGKVISSEKKGCDIRLELPLHRGDGIEIWNKKQKHTGCGISAEYPEKSVFHADIYGENGAAVYRSFDKQLNDRLKKTYAKPTRQTEIRVSFSALPDSPMKLVLHTDNKEMTVLGGIPQKAENKPMTADDFITRLQKTGGTPFKFVFSETNIADGLFVPASELNELRRNACDRLKNYLTEKYKRKTPAPHIIIPECKTASSQKLTVFTEKTEIIETILKYRPYRIYIEINTDNADDIIKYTDICHANGIQIYAALPRIARSGYMNELSPTLAKLEKSRIDGFLLRNYGFKTAKDVMHDYCFNVTNSLSTDILENVTLSPELTAKELRCISGSGKEIVIYGHFVLMSTHQCPIGNGTGHKKGKFCSEKNTKDVYFLKDRTGAKFPVMPHCRSCTAFILNNLPVFTANRMNDIIAIGAEYMRLDFTVESSEQADKILRLYTDAFLNKQNSPTPDFEYTGGHYFRGVL